MLLPTYSRTHSNDISWATAVDPKGPLTVDPTTTVHEMRTLTDARSPLDANRLWGSVLLRCER
ncbi:MAG: hypothetical protein RJA70_2363 [Pseudomonadota bacterium]|jgi:hypothetical protein